MLVRNQFYLRVGRRLRAARRMVDWNSADMARELGLDPEEYRRMEAGETPIDLASLREAARITGKSLEFLTNGRSRRFDE